MKGIVSPRSYGTKLLEPNNHAKVESPVTTRMYNVEHYERTGELEYLDEEGTTMQLISAVEKTKIMRAEITTIEQFEAIGNTSDVSRKYDVNKGTVQGLKISLQVKKAREEAEKSLETQEGSSADQADQADQVFLEPEAQELLEVEGEETVNVVPDETGECQPENIEQAALNHIGDREVASKSEPCYLIDGDPIKLSEDTLGIIIDALEEHWEKPEKDIEELWKSISTGIRTLHKMHLNRAEIEFQERLTGVIAEC